MQRRTAVRRCAGRKGFFGTTGYSKQAMLKEFKEFAVRGNVVDMAVGIIIGAAFGAIAKSLVDNVLMPPLGLLIGDVDFESLMIVLQQGTPPGPYETVAAAQAAGAVTINYGLFINSVVSFILVAFAVFLLVRYINKLKRPPKPDEPAPPPTMKKCPYCITDVPAEATRCPHCTSALEDAAPAAA